MARGKPRKQCHLKILDKLKIITLYEKEAGMPMRKFTDLVEIKVWFEGQPFKNSRKIFFLIFNLDDLFDKKLKS